MEPSKTESQNSIYYILGIAFVFLLIGMWPIVFLAIPFIFFLSNNGKAEEDNERKIAQTIAEHDTAEFVGSSAKGCGMSFLAMIAVVIFAMLALAALALPGA